MTTRFRLHHVLSLAVILSAVSGCQSVEHAPTSTALTQRAMSPDQALASLVAGNERFVAQDMASRDLIAQVVATADGQHPYAVVLGCIDSRVPPELVFDQGIGDIFSARVAGNFANTDIIGSLEFATKLAGSKLIVVLGHTECGAIKGACDDAKMGNLTHTLGNLLPAVRAVTNVAGDRNSSNPRFVQAVCAENVRLTVEALTSRSSVMRELVEKGQLRIVGAMHEVNSGQVIVFD